MWVKNLLARLTITLITGSHIEYQFDPQMAFSMTGEVWRKRYMGSKIKGLMIFAQSRVSSERYRTMKCRGA